MFEITETTEEIVKGIGMRMCEHRLALGLTQEELAGRAGVSKRSLERLEAGDANPQLVVFVSVCRALGLSRGFETLLPAVELGPLALAEGKRLPKRIRKSSKRKNFQWGDET